MLVQIEHSAEDRKAFQSVLLSIQESMTDAENAVYVLAPTISSIEMTSDDTYIASLTMLLQQIDRACDLLPRLSQAAKLYVDGMYCYTITV